MASSTLHSDSLVPWRALALLAVALAAWAAGALYTVRFNPELVFFRRADEFKRVWVRELNRDHQSKVVIFGGSSCGTSVDGERMLQRHGLPVANLGLHAGMGARVIGRYALEQLRPGDTLLVSVEPSLLTGSIKLESLGVQFAFATRNLGLLGSPELLEWPSLLLELRPGGYHALTLAGKIALRQPLYRYSLDELHRSGWHEVVARREFDGPPEKNQPALSPEARRWLASLREVCAGRQVRLAYALPLGYCPDELAAQYRRHIVRFLLEVSELIPVLRDPGFGSDPVRAHFADTPWHPTVEGATWRTDELARQIKAWETWTPDDLKKQLSPVN